eukprot:195267-Chlamydomonas_euryale.AAC.2
MHTLRHTCKTFSPAAASWVGWVAGLHVLPHFRPRVFAPHTLTLACFETPKHTKVEALLVTSTPTLSSLARALQQSTHATECLKNQLNKSALSSSRHGERARPYESQGTCPSPLCPVARGQDQCVQETTWQILTKVTCTTFSNASSDAR